MSRVIIPVSLMLLGVWSYSDDLFSQQYTVPLHNQCGNIEFISNFMHPSLYLFNSTYIATLSLQDSMELQNAITFVLGGQAKSDPLFLSDISICSRKVLFEVCTVDETLDSLTIEVDLSKNICYLD